MARKKLLLSVAIFFTFLLFTSPAPSQITSDGTPVEIGDTWELTFIKFLRDGSAMPDPTLVYDETAETYEVTAAGTDIWDSQDGCAFIYYEIPTGDWSVRVSVNHEFTGPATNAWSKAGVMVRDDPTPESKFVFYADTRVDGGDAALQWRTNDNTAAEYTALDEGDNTLGYPHWLRLDRVGDDFIPYHSEDNGVTWTQGANPASYTNATYSDPVYVGFALTSHEATVETTMTFGSFEIPGYEPGTTAKPGDDQWVYGGDTVTLDGSKSRQTDTYHWEQVIVGSEPTVTIADPDPTDGITTFVAPGETIGYTLTFRLSVHGATEDDSAETQVFVRSTGPPLTPPTNLLTIRTDRGFWLYWDDVFDAAYYEIQIEYLPDVWVPVAPSVYALEYEIKDQDPGNVIPVRVVGKNKHGKGAISDPVSMTIMRNLGITEAEGGDTPPTATFDYDGNAAGGLNDGNVGSSADSYGTAAVTEDWWGYTWDEDLWFDEITYITGQFYSDGGWFTDLAVEFTEDGVTWKDAPNLLIDPPYVFTNAPASREDFTRYTITFGTIRGTGIRISGAPGGMNTFTSVAELQIYGNQARGDLVVQGLDLEIPETGTATLDGSYTMSLLGDIVSYSWAQTGGPTVAIADSTAAVTTFTAPSVEEDTVLVFSLTAGDGTNEGTDADVRVTVKNVTTTAVAGVDQTVVEGTVVNLDGTGSQTATGALTYSWVQTAGVEVTLSDAAAPTCSFTAPEIWPYVHRLTFELAVDDGEDGTGSDVVNVNVTNSVFEAKPLATYYWQDLLHLGNTPEDRFLGPLDLSLDTNDYLANWGGQANVNPVEGEAYDFTDTGISTSVNPMVWTPVHRDNGWFMWEGRAGQALDTFGQIYHIYIFSPDEREAKVHARYDDEVRIWNNGGLVHSDNSWDLGYEHSSRDPFTLNEGVNSMTLRFEEGDGGNSIAARLTDTNDVPFTDLSYALSVRSPLPAAYGLRALPDSYASPGTVNVEVSVRADPDHLPTTIAVKEILPEGVTVADAGGGTEGAGTLTWTFDGVSSAVISYSLSVPAGTTAALTFDGDINAEDTLGDQAAYAVPSAPVYVSLDTVLGAQLSWSAPPEEGADAYRVYRSVDGGDWAQVAFTRETFYSEGMVEGSTYSYEVMAISKTGVEGPFSDATEAATVIVPTLVEAENYNYGGGLYPGYRECPAANEAPDSDTVGTLEEYDFFFANDIPECDPGVEDRRCYRPNDNCAMQEDRPTANIGWITVGDWWRYTLDVPEPGPEDPPDGWARVGLLVASNGTCELYWDEGLVGTVSFATGGSDDFRWYVLEDAFRTTPGEHTLRVKFVSGAMDIDTIGLGFNQKISREAIFEDDFEDYTTFYNWNDLETVGNWDVTNGSGEPDVGWRLWNTAGDYLGDETDDRDPAIAGMTGNYVISDSDLVGTAALDEELVTPDIDCTEYIRLKLDFSKNFRVYPDDFDHSQIAEVDIREVGGGWVNLLSYNVDSIDPNLDPAVDSSPEKLDLSAYDGKTFQLRWHFYDAMWDWWWAIDNIMVSGEPKPTTPPPKGVILSVGIAAGKLSVTWSVFGTESYYIDYTADLTGAWSEVAGPLTGTSSSDVVISDSAGFYRVRAE